MILEHKINKPESFIFDYLTNMEKFVSVHPIIYKMIDRGNNNYKVYEKLGPVSFVYTANVRGDYDKKTVHISAVVMKLTKIEMVFHLREENGSTHIHETIHFRSPLPVKAIMGKIFEKQHKQLFSNIENVKQNR